MALHFERSEFDARRDRLMIEMTEKKLDAVLLFAQESMYWLTGYDTFGFCFFQCLYVGADGRTALITRSPDLRQAQRTSNIADIRVWKDARGADPTRDLATMLVDLGARGRRLGVEYDSYGLTHFNGLRLAASLDGVATLVEASRVVPQLRVAKSAAEIACVRQAAVLSDAADRAAIALVGPGAD